MKCLLLGEDVLTVEVLSGTGTGGQTDGAKAKFSQPTSCYTEASTVYVTDLATGTLKMITRPGGLLKYLENLNKFLSVFGGHRRNEPRANVKTFSAKEAIAVIGQVNGFFKHCISEVRKITNLTTILQGPDGVCSQQTIRDLEVTLSTLKHIVVSIENIPPEYVSKLDMASVTTLVVENLCRNEGW